MKKNVVIGLAALAILGVVIAVALWPRGDAAPIRYGISPFQDTAMPVVARDLGLYKKAGLDVELRTIGWEDIVPSLASGGDTIEVGIGSINLLLPRAENINVKGGGDVIFYYPLYVFKGASLVARKELGLTPLSEFQKRYPGEQDRALSELARQLRGKRIGVPKGSPYEQMLFSLLKGVGLDPDKDITRRDVKLADALPALLRGDLDIAGAGVTQRTEASRSGHEAIVDMEGMGFAEIIGLVTTKRYAEKHPDEIAKLVRIWFESVDTLFSDVKKHSSGVLAYLAKNSSTKYSLEEYQTALTFQEFPRSAGQARQLMLDPGGRFYWKRTWDTVNDYLMQTTGQAKPIPYDYFWGDRIKGF